MEGAPRPSAVGALAIGEHIEAVRAQLLEELRTPALAIEGHGEAPLTHQPPHLGQDLTAQHRAQVVIGRCGHHEQRLGVLLVHPNIGRGRHAQAAPRDPRLGQPVRAAVIGPHVAVDVEQPHGLGVLAHPALGEPSAELRGALARGQLPKLAPQRLCLGGAIQPQQHAQFPRRMPLQLLGVRMRSSPMKAKISSVARKP